jgi:hypothetical protein
MSRTVKGTLKTRLRTRASAAGSRKPDHDIQSPGLMERLCQWLDTLRPTTPLEYAALAALVLSVVYAWLALPMPLQYDEVYNLQNYAVREVDQIRRDFTYPNNHIAWTIALHDWMQFLNLQLATLSESAMRLLPTMLSTLGIIFYVAVLRSALPGSAGLLLSLIGATILAMQRQFYYVMPVSLRGYWPSIACMVLLMLTLRAAGRERFGFLRAIIACGLLLYFAYIVPSNLWFAAPMGMMVVLLVLYSWMNAEGSSERSFAARARIAVARSGFWLPIVAMLLGLLLVRIAYDPVWAQIRGGSMPAKSVRELLSRLPRQLTEFSQVLCLTRSAALDWLLIVAGAVTTAVLGFRGDERARWSFFVAAVPAMAWPLLASYSTPSAFPRNFSPVAPLALLTFLWGVVGVATAVARMPLGSAALRDKFRIFAPAGIAVVVMVIAILHGVSEQQRTYSAFQPQKLVAMLARELDGQRSIAAYKCNDYAVAIEYYNQRLKAPRPIVHTDYLPANIIPSVQKLLLITQNTAEADEMAVKWNLGANWRQSHPPIAQVGDFSIYRVR